MNCSKNSTYCDVDGKPYSSEILALMRNTKRDECFACKPSPVLTPSADYTLHPRETSVTDGSQYYVEDYEYKINWGNMDWRHIASNGVGIVGDAATIAAILDPLPVADDVAVAGVAATANAIGVGVDAYDILAENDFSGSATDTLLFVAQKTNALKRIVPVFGLGVHIRGLAEAIVPGIQTVPVLAPINP